MKKFIAIFLFCVFAIMPAFSNQADYIDALKRSIDNTLPLNDQYSACIELQNDESVPEALQEAVFFRKIHLIAASADNEKTQELLEKYKKECSNISENYKVNKLYSGLYEIAVGNVKKGDELCDQALGIMLYESGNSMKEKAKGLYKDIYTLVGDMCSDKENAMENIQKTLNRIDK